MQADIAVRIANLQHRQTNISWTAFDKQESGNQTSDNARQQGEKREEKISGQQGNFSLYFPVGETPVLNTRSNLFHTKLDCYRCKMPDNRNWFKIKTTLLLNENCHILQALLN